MKKALSICLLLVALSSLASAQSDDQYLVNSKTLNMRYGPDKYYAVLKTFSFGDKVTFIKEYENDWWYVDIKGTKGYVFSQLLKKDPFSGWKKKNYQSGVTPECENVIPQYDYGMDNYLRIHVGSGTDVVVKLMKLGYDGAECIRIVYVRSSETYEIKNIKEGKYYLKIAYGKDYRQKIEDNQCYVKFMINAQYEKGSEILDFNKIKQPNQRIGNDIYENWNVPSYELLLDVKVTKGTKSTFKANDISEAEFNN